MGVLGPADVTALVLVLCYLAARRGVWWPVGRLLVLVFAAYLAVTIGVPDAVAWSVGGLADALSHL